VFITCCLGSTGYGDTEAEAGVWQQFRGSARMPGSTACVDGRSDAPLCWPTHRAVPRAVDLRCLMQSQYWQAGGGANKVSRVCFIRFDYPDR
jgi:hypothetical protein